MGRDLTKGTRSAVSLRELDWSYYDTLVMLNTTLETRLFTQGLAGSTKQLWQTNMKLNGQIPTGERLVVKNLKLFYTTHADVANTVIANIIALMKTTSIQVKIGGADSVLTLNLQEVLGDPLMVSLAIGQALAFHPLPNPRFHGIFPLNKPLIFAENETVEVLVTHHVAPNAALNGDWLQISLNGILERKLS